jgi:hypothetical protein
MRGGNRYCLHLYMRGFDTFGAVSTDSLLPRAESHGRNPWVQQTIAAALFGRVT